MRVRWPSPLDFSYAITRGSRRTLTAPCGGHRAGAPWSGLIHPLKVSSSLGAPGLDVETWEGIFFTELTTEFNNGRPAPGSQKRDPGQPVSQISLQELSGKRAESRVTRFNLSGMSRYIAPHPPLAVANRVQISGERVRSLTHTLSKRLSAQCLPARFTSPRNFLQANRDM
jgi:hypothetical protein